jgi:hypothetical protein
MRYIPKRSGGARRVPRFYLLMAVMVCAALAFAVVSLAGTVGTQAGFEDDDANLVVNSTFDWNGFAPVTWTGTAPYRVSAKTTANQTPSSNDGWVFAGFEDDAATTSDTGFAGGVKQDDDCGQNKNGKAPNKDDLKRVYIANKTVGGDVFLELAFVRIPLNSTQSSTHIGFEFNEKKLGACPASAKAGNLVKRTPQGWGNADDPTKPAHSGGDPSNPGDLLIVYDYEGGSASPTITLRHWIDSGSSLPSGQNCEISSDSPPCWSTAVDLTAAGFAEAQVNHGANGVPGAGIHDLLTPPASGSTSVDSTLGLKEFGEAGINLTDAGVFGPGVCTGFGQAEAVSRSSGNSGSAAMEDLDGPGAVSINNCGDVNITKSGSDGGSQAGAVFTLYSGSDTTGTVVGTCTVVASGQCGSSSPSFANLPPGTYTVDETTVPSGYSKDASLPVTFTLVVGQHKTLSFTDVALPGKVSISKVDDHGDPVDGAVFTIYQPASGTTSPPTGTAKGSCTTGTPTAGSGACTIDNVTPGTYTIDETVPTGYAKDPQFPKDITISNGENEIVTATDPRLFKAIIMVCRQTDDSLYKSGIQIDADGTTPNSLSRSAMNTFLNSWAASQSITLTSANRDAFEKALCGLTAGAKGGLRSDPHSSNPHDADIDINNSPLP